MKIKKSLKLIALASSLFSAVNLTACATNYIGKHRIGNKEYIQVKKPKNKYAILVLGALPKKKKYDYRLRDKALEVYDEFKDLGLSDDNIYFLANDPEGVENVDYFFTKHRFNQVCLDLSKKMTKDDILIFHYIGHDAEDSKDELCLKSIEKEPGKVGENGCFYASHLEWQLDHLKYQYAIVTIESCKSGDFTKQLDKENRIVISTTQENKLCWIFSKFSLYLIKALNGEKKADENKDKKVSLEEAFHYAIKKDFWSKKKFGPQAFFPEPQMYYEDIDPSKVFLKE